MRLERVHLKNFRCHREPISVDVGNFTALIGKNEAGKSSILEGVAIFFDEQSIDIDDASKSGDRSKVSIGCEFSGFPQQVVIDADYATNLASECILNENGNLEIWKIYDCSGAKPTMKVYANCFLSPNVADLLTLKNAQIKKRLDDLGLSKDGVNLSINAQVRSRIREHFAAEARVHTLVPLNAEDAKRAWEALEPLLPAYALFKSDRPSTDQDAEAQDPMRAALKEALKQCDEKLKEVSAFIETQVTDVAKRTLAKLQELDPSLASQLKPEFEKPTWDKVFKIALSGDEGIPVNKRGSGVRRLILLSFFRAKAESRAEDRASNVIYAVEEPETSQHPDNQRMLGQALAELTEQPGCQVMISTHTPGLARVLPLPSLRYVAIEDDGRRKVYAGTAEAYARVCKALGVHPDSNIRMFVGIEGANDIEFLKAVSNIAVAAGRPVVDLEQAEQNGSLVFLPVGGSNVIHWKNRLEGLNRPEFHVYDRDVAPPAQAKYQTAVDEINSRDLCNAVSTQRREMENYIHPDAITAVWQDVVLTPGDFDDVPELVATAVHAASGSPTSWAQLDDDTRDKKESRAKRRLNAEATAKMTIQQLDQLDPNGEVMGWLTSITEKLGGA